MRSHIQHFGSDTDLQWISITKFYGSAMDLEFPTGSASSSPAATLRFLVGSESLVRFLGEELAEPQRLHFNDISRTYSEGDSGC